MILSENNKSRNCAHKSESTREICGFFFFFLTIIFIVRLEN